MKERLDTVDKKTDRIDGRMWSLLFLGITNLLGIATTLFILLIKWAPSVAAAGK